MSLNILLVSDTMIKERTVIHGNLDPKLIYPDIKVAQDMYILPILGTALYTKLQTLVNADPTISAPADADYKLLMDKYIVDALIYYTLSELPTTISYQFWNRGVLRKTGGDTEAPSMQELVDISNKYRIRGEFYATRLKEYLKANATGSKYPEYLNPGNSCDTINPKKAVYTLPLYLGPDSDSCCDGFNNQPYSG